MKINNNYNEVSLIPLSSIRENKSNVRKVYSEEAMKELASSIATIGLIHPITVKKEGSSFRLIAGSRRLRAFKLLDRDEIPALVVNASSSEELAIMMQENINREDTTVIEEADFLSKALRRLDVNQKQLARLINKSEAYVADRIAITKYPPELIRALKNNQVSFSVARELVKIDDHKSLKSILHFAVTGGCNPRIARQWVKQWKMDKDYTPQPELIAEVERSEDGAEDTEITTGCHICHESFPLRNVTHLNICPECNRKVFQM
jgi:ParB family chromosome partitioning protein